MNNEVLERFSKAELITLIEMYSKNCLAMDGVWFQSIENKSGMDEAMEHDANAWRRFTKIEARKIKAFLQLPDNAGIQGLKEALSLRFYANVNPYEIEVIENGLIFKTLDCRVQNARKRKGLEFHPCKSVGIIEHSEFGKVIDSRFDCEAISCYPDITDNSCSCAWKFTLREDGTDEAPKTHCIKP